MLLLAGAASAVIPHCFLTGCKMSLPCLQEALFLLQCNCAPHLPLLLQGLVFGVAVMGGTIKLFDSRNYQQGPFDAFGVSQGLMCLVGKQLCEEQPVVLLGLQYVVRPGDSYPHTFDMP